MTSRCLVSRQLDCRQSIDETAEESQQAICYDTSLDWHDLALNSITALGDNSTASTYPSLTQVTVMPFVQKLCEASY